MFCSVAIFLLVERGLNPHGYGVNVSIVLYDQQCLHDAWTLIVKCFANLSLKRLQNLKQSIVLVPGDRRNRMLQGIGPDFSIVEVPVRT